MTRALVLLSALATNALAQPLAARGGLPPLTGAQPVTVGARAGGAWAPNDEGYATLPLGFSFPFGGQSYGEVGVSTNGVLVFGAERRWCDTSVVDTACPFTRGALGAWAPRAVIAPWWSDLTVRGGVTVARPGPGAFTVDFADATFSSGGPSNTARVNFRVSLFASGLVLMHYGPSSGSFIPPNVSGPGLSPPATAVGVVEPSGAATPWLPCASSGSCTMTSFPTGTLLTGPLSGSFEAVALRAGLAARDAGATVVDGEATALGMVGSLGWRAVASEDDVLDPADVEIVSEQPPLSLTPGVTTAFSAAASLGAVPAGERYVLIELDPARRATQSTTVNDVTAAGPFAFGAVDFVAHRLDQPPSLNPSVPTLITFAIENRGTQAAMAPWRLVASRTQGAYDAQTPVIASGTVAVPGLSVVTVAAPATFTPEFPWETSRAVALLVDVGNVVAEALETNNVRAVTNVPIGLPNYRLDELVVKDLDGVAVSQVPPGATVTLELRLSNPSAVVAPATQVLLLLSDDLAANLLSDTIVGVEAIPQMQPGASVTRRTVVTLPLVDRQGLSLDRRRFRLLAAVDTSNLVAERAEDDNLAAAADFLEVSSVTTDLVALRAEGPSRTAGGEIATVRCLVANRSPQRQPLVRVDAVLSPNPRISPGDVALPTEGGPRAISLDAGTQLSVAFDVRVPDWVSPGDWFTGCLVDGDAQVPESNETNNGVAGLTPTTVAAGFVSVDSVLPDARVGVSYAARLLASGATDEVRWAARGALPAGLQLSADGVVSGLPAAPGVFALEVEATAGPRRISGLAYLRVSGSGSVLTFTTRALPAVVEGVTSALQVGVSGGEPPLRFSVMGALPPGLALSPTGVLSGVVASGLEQRRWPVTLTVADAAGRTARVDLEVNVAARGNLVVVAPALPTVPQGQRLTFPLAARSIDGSGLRDPIRWEARGLPDGVRLEEGPVRLEGAPGEPGLSLVELSVTDGLGRTGATRLALHVVSSALAVRLEGERTVARGRTPTLRLVCPDVECTTTAVSGAPPPGVTVALDGTLAGVVEPSAPGATFAFLVRVTDAAGRTALVPVAISVEAEPTGCAAAPGLLIPLAGVLAARRRRRGLILVLGLGLATPAFAQGPSIEQYQRTAPRPIQYEPLQGADVSRLGTAFSGRVDLPFPFQIFGVAIPFVTMNATGSLQLPGGFSLDAVRVWNGQGFTVGEGRWAVRGTAPRRTAIFEWHELSTGTVSTTLQVVLEERTNAIRFRVSPRAPIEGSSFVGVSLGNRRLGAFPCGGRDGGAAEQCLAGELPPSTEVIVSPGPDLAVVAMSAPSVWEADAPNELAIDVSNLGGASSSAATLRLWASVNAELDANDTALGTAMVAPLAAGASTRVSASLLPAANLPTPFVLLAQIDPVGRLDLDARNDVAALTNQRLGPPRADLVVDGGSAPAEGAAGQDLDVVVAVRNAGATGAPSTVTRLMLSDNDVISPADLVLKDVATATLEGGAAVTLRERVTLPASVRGGAWFLGACVDATRLVDERDEASNCRSLGEFVVTGGPLQWVTRSLSRGTVGLGYQERLVVSGGRGRARFEATELPAGLTLDREGVLRGAPLNAGMQSLTLVAADGAETLEGTFSVAVEATAQPLSIVPQLLPAAVQGEPYSVQLSTLGGAGAVEWRLTSPSEGLVLSLSGKLEGLGPAAGIRVLQVEARDAAGARATASLELSVVRPGTLRVSATSMPLGVVGQSFGAPIVAAGGRAPLRLAVASTTLLARDFTQVLSARQRGLPPEVGLILQPEGDGRALLTGIPTQVGTWLLDLEVEDAERQRSSAQLVLRVVATEALTLADELLPDAEVGRPYDVQLRMSGDAPVGLVFELACLPVGGVGAVVQCQEAGALPSGLVLAQNGRILGVPQASGDTAFLIRALDASGRSDLKAYGLKVTPAAAAGCTTTPHLLWLPALVLGFGWRRRRTSAGLATVAVALLSLASGCARSPCPGAPCGQGMTCDPTDGRCRCGAAGPACGADSVCVEGRCVADACREVRCGGGTRCEPRSGQCTCGGARCEPGETCDGATQRCVRVEACTPSTCAAPGACDPATGECRCGGTTCSALERCAAEPDGGSPSCRTDRCANVLCSAGTTCDPGTGQCLCLGSACLPGERCGCADTAGCSATALRCLASSQCDGVVCAAGSRCDPADGRCHCGGPAGPICGASQTCLLEPPRCQGGAACVAPDGGPVSCPSSTSCDPEDGRCKCGGLGGQICAPGLQCIVSGARRACRSPCAPDQPGSCPAGQRCFVEGGPTSGGFCDIPSGSNLEYQRCGRSSDCARFDGGTAFGQTCVGATETSAGLCQSVCDAVAQECPQLSISQTCSAPQPGLPMGLGLCIPDN
ncbi:MAG: CARDB domain-containing protein [Myxococcaceae bacterium]|nr:CARDB domain-containing protein [Myxococcaceae bacterium]